LPKYPFLNIVPREPLQEASNLFDGCASPRNFRTAKLWRGCLGVARDRSSAG
jgi:hypothetical protein